MIFPSECARRRLTGLVVGCWLLIGAAATTSTAQHATTQNYGSNLAFLLQPPNGPAFCPVLSCDGVRYAFSSRATNLLASPDLNGSEDVFVVTRTFPVGVRASVSSAGVAGNGPSHAPSLSSDGDWVAFSSDASNLVAGDTNGMTDVFLHQLSSGTTLLVSGALGGGPANGSSSAPTTSGDGRWVAFASTASNLVTNDTNAVADVFLFDRLTALTSRASVSSAGMQANGPSAEPDLDGAGQLLVFSSVASNLIAADGNGVADVFLRDLVTAQTRRLSVDQLGGDADGPSFQPDISWSGELVSYTSGATDLVPGDGNGVDDIFVDSLLGAPRFRASINSAGMQANGPSLLSAVADNGNVVFSSAASNLVSGDTNGVADVFVRLPGPSVTVQSSIDYQGIAANNVSQKPDITADGRDVVFVSRADNLVKPAFTTDGNAILHRHALQGHTLHFDPEVAGLGTNLTIRAGGGSSGGLLGLFLTHQGGVPMPNLVVLANYDFTGTYTANPTIPMNPGLLGQLLSFEVLALVPGGGLADSNPALLAIQ